MNLKKNIYLFYAITFLESMRFSYPIWYLFLVNYLRFGPGDAIFINTFIGLIILIFEVPSGGRADRFGRKKVYILGYLSILFGISFYLWADKVYLFFISSFFLGLGYAMTSGNLEALIHDNLEEEGKVADYEKIQSNQYILMYLGRAFSALFAGYLYFHLETYPYIANFVCLSIGFIFVFFIKSPKQELSHETSDYAHIKKALVFISGRKDIILLMVFAGIVYSGLGNIYWFTYQPYLEKIGLDIKDLGIVYFFISIVSAGGSYLIKKVQTNLNTFFLLKTMLIALFLSSLMFAYFDNLFGLIPILVISLFFGFMMILGNTYLIKHSPKTHKSTILSIYGLVISLGYSTFCTIAGYFMQIFSLEILYTGLPIILFILLVIYIVLEREIEVKK